MLTTVIQSNRINQFNPSILSQLIEKQIVMTQFLQIINSDLDDLDNESLSMALNELKKTNLNPELIEAAMKKVQRALEKKKGELNNE